MAESLAQASTNALARYRAFLARIERKSPRTVQSYSNVVGRFLGFLEESAGPLTFTTGCLREFLRRSSRGSAAASQALRVAALRHFLKWAERDERPVGPLPEQLARELTRPKVPRKLPGVLDEEDLPILLRHLSERPWRERLLFELLYGSGLRISEAHNLKPSDWRLGASASMIFRGKGGKERNVPLTAAAAELLLQNESEIRSEGLWGRSSSTRKLRAWVQAWSLSTPLGETGTHLHPHKLRHSIATHLLRRGAKLPEIQRLLGHSRLTTTERYTHLQLDDLVRAYDHAFPLKKGKKIKET